MIRTKGWYRQGRIELERLIDLPEGAVVDVAIQADAEPTDEGWRELGLERLKEEWDNDRDAVYDDWRRLYGVPQP